MALENAVTDIVQLPAIIKSGSVKILSPELLKLDEADLKKMAMVMGGELIYMKVRATYTDLETPLCGYKDCDRPTNSLWCSDHPNGKSKSRDSNNVRPFINPKVS